MNTLVALHISTSQSWLTISSLLVGVLTPAVVAVINHPVWEPQAKRIIAVSAATVLGILTVIANGVFTDFEVNVANVVTVILAVIGAAQASYALFWKPTGVADEIETKVNPGPVLPGPVIPVNPPLTTGGHVSDPLTPPEPEPMPDPGEPVQQEPAVSPDYVGDDGGFPGEPRP